MWRSRPDMTTMMNSLVRALRTAWIWAARTARLAVGVPDYDVYVAHMRRMHPDLPPMDHAAFFAERVQARYGKGRSRCC